MPMTRTKPDGSWNVVGFCGKIIPWKDIPKELVGAICRLHDYEKTGLSPESVELIRDENKRLRDEIKKLNRLLDELQSIIEGVAE